MFCLQQDLLQRQNVPKTEETAEKDEWDRQGNENTPPHHPLKKLKLTQIFENPSL